MDLPKNSRRTFLASAAALGLYVSAGCRRETTSNLKSDVKALDANFKAVRWHPMHPTPLGIRGSAESTPSPLAEKLDKIVRGEAAWDKPTVNALLEHLESICGGRDDSQDVELYNGIFQNLNPTDAVSKTFVSAHEHPAGQLQWKKKPDANATGNVWGEPYCSGTLIDDDLFLTAAHCVDNKDADGWVMPRLPGTNTPYPPSMIATSMNVNFYFQLNPMGQEQPAKKQTVGVKKLVEFGFGNGGTLDYAILQLDAKPNIVKATISKKNASVSELLTVFGHPSGLPKRVAGGRVLAVNGVFVDYNDLDTLGGGSGSGLVSGASGRIIGVHTNGGCNTPNPGYNYGYAIEALIAKSPVLARLAV